MPATVRDLANVDHPRCAQRITGEQSVDVLDQHRKIHSRQRRQCGNQYLLLDAVADREQPDECVRRGRKLGGAVHSVQLGDPNGEEVVLGAQRAHQQASLGRPGRDRIQNPVGRQAVADKPRGAESDEPVAHLLPQGQRELQVAGQFDLGRELGEQLVPAVPQRVLRRSVCCARTAGSMAVSWMWISDVTRCPPTSRGTYWGHAESTRFSLFLQVVIVLT